MDALSSMISFLTTPIAKRKGVVITPEDCAIWAEELTKHKERYG